MQIKRRYNSIYGIDEDEYDNRADYYRDIGCANNWKFKIFGYLPKSFGTHTQNREWQGSYFYGKPPKAPKPKDRGKI